MPAPNKVVIPVLQHNGSESDITVKRGDKVFLGQIIAEAWKENSVPVHSSVSGIVTSISKMPHPYGPYVYCVEIENDGKDESIDFKSFEKSWKEAAPQELIKKIAECGIVDNNGISVSKKLSIPSDKKVDKLIINCMEVEPFITCDVSIAINKSEDFFEGILITKKIVGASKVLIILNNNNSQLKKVINDFISQPKYKDISFISINKIKYPQNNDRILTKIISGKEISSRSSTLDAGCLIVNAETIYLICQSILKGIPFYKKIITVYLPPDKTLKNLIVRIGTSISNILEYCKINLDNINKIIAGGLLKGIAVCEIDSSIIKSINAITTVKDIFPSEQKYECIKCQRCLRVCPVNIIPSLLVKLIKGKKYQEAIQYGLDECIECGCCSYVCPSKINIVHYLILGKHINNKENANNFKNISTKETT